MLFGVDLVGELLVSLICLVVITTIMQQLKKLVQRPESKARIANVDKQWSTYSDQIQVTNRAAEAVQNFQMTEEIGRLRDAVMASAKTADQLRTTVRGLVDDLDKHVAELKNTSTCRP